MNIKQLLPSKKFLIVIGAALVVVLIVIFGSSYFGSHTGFNQNRNAAGYTMVKANGTVNELLIQDSNHNGYPDWQESLYGLDPKANGDKNKQVIEAKQAQNGIVPTAPDDTGPPLTPNDNFARNLLVTVLSLKQSGSLTTAALTRLGESVGAAVDTKRAPDVPTYTIGDIHIVPDSAAAAARYERAFKPILAEAASAGVGNEIDIIASNLDSGTNSGESLKGLIPIATGYALFGKKITMLDTPNSLAIYVLTLANASDRAARALQKVSVIYTDSITGMVGLDDYFPASDDIDNASDALADYFSR